MKKVLVFIFLLFFALPIGVRADIYSSPYGVKVPMSERTTVNSGRVITFHQSAPLTTSHFQTTVNALDNNGFAYSPGQSATGSGGPHRAKRVEEDDHSDDPFLIPVGNIPWIFFSLLALAYAFRKKYAINNNVR